MKDKNEIYKNIPKEKFALSALIKSLWNQAVSTGISIIHR